MGFKYESSKRRNKNAPQRASGTGMILIFIVMGISVLLGWWLPVNVPLRQYVPIPDSWYAPILPNPEIRLIQIVVGLVAFILLQFVVVLISGFLFPLPPQDEIDEDGFIKRK
jgi:hypothetical protein